MNLRINIGKELVIRRICNEFQKLSCFLLGKLLYLDKIQHDLFLSLPLCHESVHNIKENHEITHLDPGVDIMQFHKNTDQYYHAYKRENTNGDSIENIALAEVVYCSKHRRNGKNQN